MSQGILLRNKLVPRRSSYERSWRRRTLITSSSATCIMTFRNVVHWLLLVKFMVYLKTRKFREICTLFNLHSPLANSLSPRSKTTTSFILFGDCDPALPSLVSGCCLNIFSWFCIIISTTILQNFMFNMAATVSSSGLNNVGPKQTPKLLTDIRFLSLFAATLKVFT